MFVQKNNTDDPGDHNNYITVEPPFTMEFDVSRKTLSGVNTANIRIYGLSPTTRAAIAWNMYDTGRYRRVILEAGYENNIATIFRGNIHKCESVRQGSTFLTTIDGDSGGFANVNATFNLSFVKGQNRNEILNAMLRSTKEVHLTQGTVSADPSLEAALPRGNSYSGPTIALIAELLGGGVFIDNEVINCLQDDQYIYSTNVPIVTAETGLLGTPVRQQSFLTFEVMFEPSIRPGFLVKLQSQTGLNYDGTYKVTGLQHKGTISGAVCGEAITYVQVPYIKTFAPVSERVS